MEHGESRGIPWCPRTLNSALIPQAIMVGELLSFQREELDSKSEGGKEFFLEENHRTMKVKIVEPSNNGQCSLSPMSPH